MSEQSEILVDYFHLLQQQTGKLIPPRSAFNPADVPQLLPFILMMELRSAGECFFRLVGTATVDRSGTNPQGQNYFSMLPENIQRSCARNMYILFERPCASTGLQVESYTNGEAATVEVTSLPFLDKEEGKLIIATATEVFTDDLTIPRQGNVAFDRWPEHRFLDIGAGIPK